MKYLKRVTIFLLIFSILLLMAACDGGNGGGGSDIDPEIENAIAARMDSFRKAVEDYDVEKMLDFVLEDEFELIIREISEYPKCYSTLEDELREDEDKQLRWRKAVDEGGKGYSLTMELEKITYSNTTATGSVVTVSFTIKEEAAGIPLTVTDTGTMVCDMVKVTGEWYCQRMINHFNTETTAAIGTSMSAGRKAGFGFGVLSFDD